MSEGRVRDWDHDGDGLSDFDEEWRGTDPNRADTDGDGVPDGDEVDLGWDPKKADPQEKIDRLHGSLELEHEKLDKAYEDAADMFRDTDWDGLDDYTERKIGTNPFEADTDGDGLTDGFEVQYGLDPKDNLPDPPEPEPHVPMRLPDSLASADTLGVDSFAAPAPAASASDATPGPAAVPDYDASPATDALADDSAPVFDSAPAFDTATAPDALAGDTLSPDQSTDEV
jgi:hypothetical protein